MQDVASLRVKKLETLFAQQSVRLPAAAKVSRLAHDGSQPMAPPLSSGAPCVRVCMCECEEEGGERKRERNGERKTSGLQFALDLSREAGARFSPGLILLLLM